MTITEYYLIELQMTSHYSEDRIQQEIVEWFNNTYTDLRGLLCYNLNNSKNQIDGARNRAKGLVAGRSDLTFYYAGRAFFLEVKTPEGRQSPDQRTWEEIVRNRGFNYWVVRNVLEAQTVIKLILEQYEGNHV